MNSDWIFKCHLTIEFLKSKYIGCQQGVNTMWQLSEVWASWNRDFNVMYSWEETKSTLIQAKWMFYILFKRSRTQKFMFASFSNDLSWITGCSFKTGLRSMRGFSSYLSKLHGTKENSPDTLFTIPFVLTPYVCSYYVK